MARFSDDELDDIRRNTDIVALIESYGTKLKQRPDANEYVGLCPLHDDKDASLHVNRAKGVWHCKGGCGGGDCFVWVMKAEKVSFVAAIELLKNKAVGLMAGNGTKAKYVPRLPNPIIQTASDQELIYQVAEYYHSRLAGNSDAIAYLTRRGLNDSEAVRTFKIGFCDRTLGHRIPNRQTQAGAEQRAKLDALGILKETGHESMRGCITFPILVSEGKAGELYGRRITKGTPENERHWYLKGPHVGVWNAEAFQASDTIILCEGVIDALTFWIAGFRNVTCTYGKTGFTDEIYQAFIKHDTKRCYISFDNDSKNDPNDNAAMAVANRLMSQGIECMRIEYPLNANDANAYAMMLKDGNGSAHGPLQMLINKACWLGASSKAGGGRREAVGQAKEEAIEIAPQTSEEELRAFAKSLIFDVSNEGASPEENQQPAPKKESVFGDRTFRDLIEDGLFANGTSCAQPMPSKQPNPTSASKEESQPAHGKDSLETLPTQGAVVGPKEPLLLGAKALEASEHESTNQATVPAKVPAQAGGDRPEAGAHTVLPQVSGLTSQVLENEVLIGIGNRNYRIRGLTKSSNTFDTMKINVLVRKDDAFFVDTIDLYSARNRTHFVKEACRELGLEEEVLKRDLGKILQKLELIQDEFATSAAQAETKKIEISDPDKAKALELLKSDRLIERILADFDACGVIGEQTNKLFGYIAATSRKLDKPLAMMVQSSSAAGKSSLMDAVLGFMPPEEQITYSAMTGQSLFYMGGMNLKNKILAISEEEGIRQAAYALKLLQSDGKLTIASTGKDPGTGRMETQEYHVEGPVMLFLTTTAIDVDPELMNRCTVLTVNEDREQTAAILQQQRKEETLDGMQSTHRKSIVRAIHHNAQRLLRPLGVVNPFAEELGFLDNQTRFRRDHKKYLTLIRAVALLHQYQREIKTTTIEGQVIEYIEVTHQDITLANRLADAVLGRSIDELSPQSRRLLWQLTELVREEMETEQLLQSEVRFTRKQIRDRFGWGQTQLKLHLDRLVEMEYVMAHKTGARLVEYELLYDGRGREGQPTLPGLIDPTKKGPPVLPPTILSSGKLEPSSAPNGSSSDRTDSSSGDHRPDIGTSSNEENGTSTNENNGDDNMNGKT
jgi:DNA primase catalytic core